MIFDLMAYKKGGFTFEVHKKLSLLIFSIKEVLLTEDPVIFELKFYSEGTPVMDEEPFL